MSVRITNLPEFDDHELVIFVSDSHADLRGFIAIHRGGPMIRSLGATRLWHYDSEMDALKDTLRLSKLMSYKSALAGLKYGGAKAVLMAPAGGLKKRKCLFQAFARKVDVLGGHFVTGTDVGVTGADVKVMRGETRYVIGSKVDPAYYTGLGAFDGIQASLEHVFGSKKVEQRSFAVQGIGKTGSSLIAMLYKKGSQKIFAADIDAAAVRRIKKKFPRVSIVSPRDIHKQSVDVFSPCALNGALNPTSVLELRCKIVAGSANNQLSEERVGRLLMKRGILYAPDYVINAGGLISVVDEMEHKTPDQKRILNRVGKIQKTLRLIFDRSRRYNRATNVVANRMAEKIFNDQK